MKRGPGAHVTARKGTYEKLDGQLEMSFRPPKKDLYAALYGAHRGQSLVSDFMLELMRVECLAPERYFIPREVFRSSPAQEQMTTVVAQQRQAAQERAQRDASRRYDWWPLLDPTVHRFDLEVS